MKSANSLQLSPKQKQSLSVRRSLQLPEKVIRTPTPVKFTKHATKMIQMKSLLSKLPDDLHTKITRTAYLQKKIEEKDMPRKNQKNVILDKTKSNLSLKDIISIFQLNYFNFNNNDEYKDDNKLYKIIDNETILADISSVVAEERDSPLTHRYCYKKIKIDNDDKYEIILARIKLDSQNDNDSEEYVRTRFTTDDINAYLFENPNANLEDIFVNNHVRDELNQEIIKKLKYKDLINIFNPEIDDYNKVIRVLNNLLDTTSSVSRRSIVT